MGQNGSPVKRVDYDQLHYQARTAMVAIGEAVNSHRRANKLPIRQLAEHLGIDHVKLHHLEHGRMLLDRDSMEVVIQWLATP